MEGFLVNEQSQHRWLACTPGFPMLFVSVTWCTPSLSGLLLLTFSCTLWKPSLATSGHTRLPASARSGDWHTSPSCLVNEVKSAQSEQNQTPGGAQGSPIPSPASSSRHRGWPLISNQEGHWFPKDVRLCNNSLVATRTCLVWRLFH